MKSHIFCTRLVICITFLHLSANFCAGELVKKSINDDGRDDGDSDESKDESLDIPLENEAINLTCARRSNSLMHDIKTAKINQFPFIAAVMSAQDDYLCSGSVVSNGIILTTAKCTQQPVSYVLLNATTAKKGDHVAMLHVIKMAKFPTYSGEDSLKDVGLIYIEKHNGSIASKIQLSNYSNANNLTDIEAIGFGLNTDVGQPKTLQYVGLELRSSLEATDILKAYLDCIDTLVPTCFKDTGSPTIVDNELIGIVSVGQEECTKEMTSTYAINKKMADILPTYTFKAWLDEKIKENEQQHVEKLSIFPEDPTTTTTKKPVVVRRVHHMVSKPTLRPHLEPRNISQRVTNSQVLILSSSLLYIFTLL